MLIHNAHGTVRLIINESCQNTSHKPTLHSSLKDEGHWKIPIGPWIGASYKGLETMMAVITVWAKALEVTYPLIF